MTARIGPNPAGVVPASNNRRLAAELLAFVGGLRVTQGPRTGELLEPLPWEKRFIRGAFRPGVRRAALSLARGQGKTTLAAAIAAASVVGPLAQPRAETILVASSFAQARLAFDHVVAFLGDWVGLRVLNNANAAMVENLATGARLRAIASDPSRAHGLAPGLAILDEPAQWPAAQADRMIAAIGTSLGKIAGARLVAIGTRPADSGHWFGKWLDSADYAQMHAAGRDDPPFRISTWRKANPSLDAMPELRAVIKSEADRAARDAGELAAFRALRLNQGVSDTANRQALLDADAWERCEGALPAREGPSAWGVDLGSGAAMSAVAAYWPATGRLECLAAFPSIPSLDARERSDGVGRNLYRRMFDRGELHLLGEHVADVPALLRLALHRFGPPAVVVADRWRAAELKEALGTVVPVCDLSLRGQGYFHGGEDIRLFRRAALDGRIRAGESLLLRAALGEAVTVSDPAGNAKLCKNAEGGRRARARDDAAAAAILAVAEGQRRGAVRPPRRLSLGAVV